MLIGIVQVVRAQWFDTIVFFAAAAVVGASGLLPASSGRAAPLRALMVGAVIIGAALCVLPRHSGWMQGGVIGVGAAAPLLTWRAASADRRPWTAGARRMAAAWAGMLVIGCLWELAQFIAGEIDPTRPSWALSDLVDPMLGDTLGKTLFIAAWVACGAFLLRRGVRR
ncbi:MAG: hypothetical protein IPM00_16675 [Tetrasphaera sp.]|nr:hypothetical protein [Tetrasphaera sp.]